jgi:hypothetical protein
MVRLAVRSKLLGTPPGKDFGGMPLPEVGVQAPPRRAGCGAWKRFEPPIRGLGLFPDCTAELNPCCDLRVVAATNKNLREAVEAKTYRAELGQVTTK